MGLLSFLLLQTFETSSSRVNEKIKVIELFGQKILLVNNVQQTGPYVNSLFENGLRCLRSQHNEAIKEVVMFGVGGGGVLFQLERAYPASSIIAVDYDPEIIRLGKKYFGFEKLKRTTFVISDARKFITERKNQKQFDLVVIDLYIGNDVPDFATSVAFLKGMRKLLTPTGSVMMNYFSSKNQPKNAKLLLDKLSKIFQSVNSVPNKRNIFFFCRNSS